MKPRRRRPKLAPPPTRAEFPDAMTFFDAAQDWSLYILGDTDFALSLFILDDAVIEEALKTRMEK